MKSYDEIAARVFERRDEYEKNKAVKKKKVREILAPCAVVLIAAAVVALILAGGPRGTYKNTAASPSPVKQTPEAFTDAPETDTPYTEEPCDPTEIPDYIRYVSEYEEYSEALARMLESGQPEGSFTYDHQGVYFGFEGDQLIAYKEAYFASTACCEADYSLAVPLASYPAEVGIKAKQRLAELDSNVDPEKMQLFGFIEEDCVVFVSEPLHDQQAHVIFSKGYTGDDEVTWQEEPAPASEFRFRMTGTCVARADLLCFFDRSHMSEETYTPRKLTVVRYDNGGWKDIELEIPEEYEGLISPPCTALSPACTDIKHGEDTEKRIVIPVAYTMFDPRSESAFDYAHIALFISNDSGTTWEFVPDDSLRELADTMLAPPDEKLNSALIDFSTIIDRTTGETISSTGYIEYAAKLRLVRCGDDRPDDPDPFNVTADETDFLLRRIGSEECGGYLLFSEDGRPGAAFTTYYCPECMTEGFDYRTALAPLFADPNCGFDISNPNEIRPEVIDTPKETIIIADFVETCPGIAGRCIGWIVINKQNGVVFLMELIDTGIVEPECFNFTWRLPGTDAENAELINSLLPDWECSSQEGTLYKYRSVNRKMMNAYITSCVSKGFRYVRQYEDLNSFALLYRDDIWIDITDNTQGSNGANGSCSLTFIIRSAEGGMTAAEALRLVGDGGTGVQPVAALDVSPDGMYANTGMQLFRVLYVDPVNHTDAPEGFKTAHFLVGGGEAVMIEYYMQYMSYLGSAYGDVNGDGSCEVVTINGLPFNSWSGLGFSVYKLEGGHIAKLAGSTYKIGANGKFSLASHDGKAYYCYQERLDTNWNSTPVYGELKEYEITIENGKVTIIDPAGEAEFEYKGLFPLDWGHHDDHDHDGH